MTTDAAFTVMIHTRGIHNKLQVRRGTVGKWRHDLKEDTGKISLDKKINLLQRAGYIMRQDMRWNMPGQTVEFAERVDYLNEFPTLTLLGKLAGMNDDEICERNKALITNPEKLLKFYKQI